MKFIPFMLFCVLIANSVWAASCPDLQESANTAAQARNGRVAETHNTMMPDPEEEREGLSQCLNTIHALGDPFTLGVQLPGIEEVVSGMCKQVDSFLQQKINEVQSQVMNAINDVGGNNPLKVYGTGEDIVVQLKGKLK